MVLIFSHQMDEPICRAKQKDITAWHQHDQKIDRLMIQSIWSCKVYNCREHRILGLKNDLDIDSSKGATSKDMVKVIEARQIRTNSL